MTCIYSLLKLKAVTVRHCEMEVTMKNADYAKLNSGDHLITARHRLIAA